MTGPDGNPMGLRDHGRKVGLYESLIDPEQRRYMASITPPIG